MKAHLRFYSQKEGRGGDQSIPQADWKLTHVEEALSQRSSPCPEASPKTARLVLLRGMYLKIELPQGTMTFTRAFSDKKEEEKILWPKPTVRRFLTSRKVKPPSRECYLTKTKGKGMRKSTQSRGKTGHSGSCQLTGGRVISTILSPSVRSKIPIQLSC